MKKISPALATFSKIWLAFCFSAFIIAMITAFTFSADKSAAQAEQREGIYIFICSKPATGYDYLGSVKKSFAITGQPDEMLNSMIKKAKKDFPTCQGIIFTSAAMDKADCIKFKE